MTVSELGFIILNAICVMIIAFGLSKISIKVHGNKKPVIWFSLITIIWLTFTGFVADNGLLNDFSSFPPKLMPVILLPPLILILVLTFSKALTKLLLQVPIVWLIYFQVFRVVVELLIWGLHKQGLAPVQMSFEGLNYDIWVGLTAPLVAYLYQKRKISVTGLKVWNVCGILILLNILVIAVLSMPTPMQVFMNDPANTIVATFPVVWLPALLVPLAYGMHALSLRQLRLIKKHNRN